MIKQKFINLSELNYEIKDLYNALNNKESDLACILIGANFLDVSLATILKIFLKNSSVTDNILDHNKGFLGNFKNRMDICYCLNLIEKNVYQDLMRIAEIRNIVAHNHILDGFENQEISEKCNDLHFWKLLIKREKEKLFNRHKFNFTVVIISQKLLCKAFELKEK